MGSKINYFLEMWGLRVLQTFKHENLVGSFILGFGTPREAKPEVWIWRPSGSDRN